MHCSVLPKKLRARTCTSVDMDMDGKFHIHGKPVKVELKK